MKKALIIGSEGFVGYYLQDELLKNNFDVYCSDIKTGESRPKYYEIDLLNKDLITIALKEINPDYIINLAAISSVKLSWIKPELTFDVNVKGVVNLFEVVKNLNLKTRVLLIGSSEEYGQVESDKAIDEKFPLNALNPYAISKMTQEKIAHMYHEVNGIDVIMVRAFNHIGPTQNRGFVIPDFAEQIAKIEAGLIEPKIYVGNLCAERDFTDVRDIVSGYRLLLQHGNSGEVYNIGSGNVYSIKSVLDFMVKNSKVEIDVEIDKNKFRPVETPKLICNCSKIKQDVKWEPKITVEESLNEILDYWRIKVNE